jgi:hypothetical protein
VSRGDSIRGRWAISIALGAGLIAFLQSYRCWLDPVIDAGRDLYIPEQLRLGATLYRDILYFYPPLTPYLLAAITAVTGSSLGAYIAIGLVTSLLTATAIWMIAHPLAGTYGAACALLIFFSFSMAGVGGWGCNYFFPYAHAATLAMLFFLAAAALQLRGRWGLAVLLLVAASWTKIEYAVFSIAVLGAQVLGWRASSLPVLRLPLGEGAGKDAGEQTGWRPALLFVLVNAVLLTGAIAFFGLAPLRANVLPPSLLGGASAQAFYARVTGMAMWPSNLAFAARGAALIAVFVVLLYAWDRRPRWRPVIFALLAITAYLLANDTFFRAWTILQLVLIPFAIRKPREPLALLLLVSLCTSSRIFLNIVPAWYGFVFITPVVVLMVYVLFEWLPARGVYSHQTARAWMAIFAMISVSGMVAAHMAYAPAQPVTTKRGLYYDTSPGRAEAVSGLLRHLKHAGASELVVMPEGLAINYLSGVRTPLRHQTFTPVEIAGTEILIVAELEAAAPRYVAIVHRDVREFGYRGFGIDYGREIVTWLAARYEVEARFGTIILLRRRH